MDPEEDDGEVGGLPSMDYYKKDISPIYAEKDIVDHRQVYVGVHHMPAEKPNRRSAKFQLAKRPPKGIRWENGKKNPKDSDESASEDPDHNLLPPPASERVKFILGVGNDEEQATQENPQLFTELEELFVYLDGNVEWKETARWYKYEEDVEEGGDRWSKPHVATLSLYSLFELRSSLMAGTVMLDMDASTLSEIADLVLDNLISCNKLEELYRLKVRNTLLRKHHHQRHQTFRRNLSNIIGNRKSSNILHTSASSAKFNATCNLSRSNIQLPNGHENSISIRIDSLVEDGTKPKLFRNYSQPAFPISAQQPKAELERSESVLGHLVYPTQTSHTPSGEDDSTSDRAPAFMKKLPSNAEASNVLVGEVDFLERPITAFVRLASSSVIGDLTEVPIPTRFLFIMLGPSLTHGRYHEIGRAISTLLSDEVFHNVVYRAKSREDLIAGIDEFLEQVTVLPRGEWDPSIRIEPQCNGYAKFSRCATMENHKNQELVVEQVQSCGSDTGESTDGGEGSHKDDKRNFLFHGLAKDFEIWKSRQRDLKDGLNFKCFGTVFFIYFLLLAILMIAGNHENMLTKGYIGIREYLLSIGITGLVFSMFNGQPLLILSYTVPLSLFDGLLFKICNDYNLDFLPFRLWIGIWTMLLLLLFVAVNMSNCVQYLTRFTLEIFSVLSSLILLGYGFVYLCQMLKDISDMPGNFVNQSCQCIKYSNLTILNNSMNTSVGTIASVLNVHFRDCTSKGGKFVGNACSHDAYPFTMLLTLFTVFTALFLTSFKHFGLLPNKIHQFFHNFSTLIVVCIVSAVANQFNINIQYLPIPKDYHPSGLRMMWVVEPLGSNQLWILILAFLPAIFLTLIIFTEQQVTACCINKNKILKKGFGYHIDLFIVLLGVGVAATLGLPFTVASVVMSVNHVQSLTAKKTVDDFIGGHDTVKEQRVTGLLIYTLILLTPTMQPLLKYVPVPVLYGFLLLALIKVFIGVQFVNRCTLLLMQRSQQIDLVYLRQVPTISTNIMTVIQVVCTIVLWSIRSTVATVVFPLMIILLVIVRALLEYVLPIRDILVLDEPMIKIDFRLRRPESKSVLVADAEAGTLLEEHQTHEDVLPDHNKAAERVSFSEELNKTAAWKQLTYVENPNSPLSTSPKLDTIDSKKRRRKRSRESLKKDEGNSKRHEETALLAIESAKNDSSNDRIKRKSSVDKQSSNKRGESKNRGSVKRKNSHDRGSVKRQSSQERKHKKKSPVEEAPLPPWEQPYHSPPRRDFGLLKIPEDDLSFDPACLRTDSPKSSSPTPESSHMHSPTNSLPRSSNSTPDEVQNSVSDTPVYSGDASWEEDNM